MQKLQKSLLALSMLFILGACSTVPNNNNDGNGGNTGDGDTTLPPGVGSTGDPLLDEALKDSLDQIGSVSGLTHWMFKSEETCESLDIKWVDNYFIGTDTYKIVSLTLYDGNDEEMGSFDNEIIYQTVEEGSFPSTGQFKIMLLSADVTDDLASEGYNKIYTFAPKKVKEWYSSKIDEESGDQWVDIDDLSPEYILVKEDGDKLSMIGLSKQEKDTEAYDLNGNTVEEAIENAMEFIKK
ncbi:MAG: hypothetical protein ACRC0X_04935 [Brevinema sp.]